MCTLILYSPCLFHSLVLTDLFGVEGLKAKSSFNAWPTNFDLFFTFVLASTLSDLLGVQVEVFSSKQLIITTILTLLGAKIFTSMIRVVLAWFNLPMLLSNTNSGSSLDSRASEDQVEVGILSTSDLESNNVNDQVQKGNVDT